MARQQDLLSQLEQIGRSLDSARTLMSAEPQGGEHINALRELDRAEFALHDGIDQVRQRLGLAPSRRIVSSSQRATPARKPPRQAALQPLPAMIQCPHCEAQVKPENLDRHIQKVHRARSTARRPAPGAAPQPARQVANTPTPPARGSSPGVKLPGPTHHGHDPRSSSPRMEQLAHSETLRKITLELEMLNHDLYRDD